MNEMSDIGRRIVCTYDAGNCGGRGERGTVVFIAVSARPVYYIVYDNCTRSCDRRFNDGCNGLREHDHFEFIDEPRWCIEYAKGNR